MIMIFKKAQQEYIANMLKDSTTRLAWAEKDGVYIFTGMEGMVVYMIPKPLLYIRLNDEKKAQFLEKYLQDPDGMEPARVVHTDAQRNVKLQSEHHTVYANENLLKPFLAAKGARLGVTGPLQPIRVYANGYPFCIGLVVPCKPSKAEG